MAPMSADAQFRAPVWSEVASRKHRRSGPTWRQKWADSELARWTTHNDSVYSPYLTRDTIERIEMETVQGQGVEINVAAPHFRRFYRRFDGMIGASEGKKTQYILVQWNRDGTVHGYPVTERYLRQQKGVDL
jgi:hypothetical protein